MKRMPNDEQQDHTPPRPGDPPPPPFAPDLDLIDLRERGARVTDRQPVEPAQVPVPPPYAPDPDLITFLERGHKPTAEEVRAIFEG